MTKIFQRFIPTTMVSQLMILLLFVLVLAQIVNLFIIIGERRIQARTNIFNTALNNTADIIQQLPTAQHKEKFNVLDNRHSNGFFFLSESNIALELKDSKSLVKYKKNLLKFSIKKIFHTLH